MSNPGSAEQTVSLWGRTLGGVAAAVVMSGGGATLWAAVQWAPGVDADRVAHAGRLAVIEAQLADHAERFATWDSDQAEQVAADAAIVELCKSGKLTDKDECERAGYVVERARVRLLLPDPIAAAERRAERAARAAKEEHD